ncbi:hypothetical protein K6L09_41630 [Burkholderia cepacia]
MSALTEKIGAVAGMLIQQAMATGLAWDEAVAAFGLASKAVSQAAASAGDASLQECIALARQRFDEAFSQKVEVVVAGSDLRPVRDAYNSEDALDLLANANVRSFKVH